MAEIKHIPAQAFSLAEMLWDEMQARGWTTDDVAARMPADSDREAGMNLLRFMLVMAVQRDGCTIGNDMFEKLAAAFGISEQYLRNLDDTWRGRPGQRVPFECPDEAFGPRSRACFPKPH